MLALSGCAAQIAPAPPPKPTIEVILTGLENPRGIAVGAGGELFVAEAGTGHARVDPTLLTGRLTKYVDLNGDGDFDDSGEAERWFSHFPTYNAAHFAGSVRDEVGGPSDLLLHANGRLYLTLDGGFDQRALYEISPEGRIGRNLVSRGGTMNSIAFDRDQERIYVAESSFNQLIEVTLEGEFREIAVFPKLASSQEAVPAGLAVDANSGEVLVALFSGAVVDSDTDEVILFIPGDAKVVRVDPNSGAFADEVLGLTTAVDVAQDAKGNLYVLEMAAELLEPFPLDFDLTDPDAPPVHGGYKRFSGRVTIHPSSGAAPMVLIDGLDTPTNLTFGPDCALYVSTGQCTPGRPIPGPDGPTRIVGQILRITNLPIEACD
jgi:sugar lactone lactonase YvrE